LPDHIGWHCHWADHIGDISALLIVGVDIDYLASRRVCADVGASAGRDEIFVEHLQTVLGQGDKINLPSIGQFEVAERAARKGRNPQTGEPINIPASKAVKFRAGKALKDVVNGLA